MNKRNDYYMLTLLFLILLFPSCGGKKVLKFKSAKDVKGVRMCLVSGTFQDEYAKKHFKDCEFVYVENLTDLYSALQYNKADVAFGATPSTKEALAVNHDLAILDSQVVRGRSGYGFSKKDVVARDRFNDFLKKSQADGTLNAVMDKWINHSDTATVPKLVYPGKNGTLKLVITGQGPPYTLIKNGEPAGFDVEFVKRFGAYADYKIDVVLSNFAGMISGGAIGKYDIVGDNLCITEERSKKLLFTNPHSYEWCSLIVRKSDLAKTMGTEEASDGNVWQTLKTSFYRNFIAEDRYMLLVNGLLVTTIISVLSALFGTLIGAIICFFRMKKNKWASRSASAFIDFMRCIPQLVFLMILFYVVFSESNLSGLWVSVIAFSLIFGAYVSEMFRVAIEGIDKGQWEAGLAMGFSRVKTFRILILPLAVQRIIPVYKGELIGLIKSTSIVGYIAVQDMTKASDLIRGVTFDPFFPLIIITIIYFALIWILTRSISYADWRTKPRRRIL